MLHPRDKAGLLASLRREHAFWEALLAVVGEEDMLTPGVTEDWSFKDVVAHLTGWRKRTAVRLAGARPGAGSPRPADWPAELGEDVQAVNDWLYRTNRERPLADVLAESRQVWQQLLDAVEARPEADLMEPGRFGWLEGHALGPALLNGSLQHLHEHAAQINDWLARRRDND